jgi:hypothetical protein
MPRRRSQKTEKKVIMKRLFIPLFPVILLCGALTTDAAAQNSVDRSRPPVSLGGTQTNQNHLMSPSLR